MSDEWKGPGPNLANARNKRVERAQPELVKNTITQLEAISAVKPEYAPVVSIALAVTKAAQAKVEALEDRVAIAEERARLAEELVANVKPHVDELAAQNETLASHLRAQREKADEEQTEKAAVAKRADVAKSISEMAAGIAEIRRAQEALPRSPEFQLLKAIHSCTRDQEGRSAIVNRSEFAGGPWEVVATDGEILRVCEKRSEAVALVKKLYDDEMKAAEKDAEQTTHDDALDSPRAARRKKQPGEKHDGQPPATTGIQYEPSKSARKRSPRIL